MPLDKIATTSTGNIMDPLRTQSASAASAKQVALVNIDSELHGQ
jgi:hypothetical protein